MHRQPASATCIGNLKVPHPRRLGRVRGAARPGLLPMMVFGMIDPRHMIAINLAFGPISLIVGIMITR